MTLNNYPSGVLNRCPVCQSDDIRVFLSLDQVPTYCNVHYHTRTEALGVTRGDIQLAACGACGHIFNLCFDPSIMQYDGAYENSLHYSPRFQQYAEALVDDLIERHDVRHKVVIDVGCGKGDFLHLICERGQNRGIGFDPSYVPDGRHTFSTRFIRDYYSEKYSNYRADLVCCRHVLEHIYTPRDFLNAIRRSIGDQASTAVFFEVPNALYTVRDLGIWDIIYEHYSYFTMNSLVALFQSCGFSVKQAQETFGGQFLTIEAVLEPGDAFVPPAAMIDQGSLASLIDAFGASYRHKLAEWQAALGTLSAGGKRTVIWGGGSKGVTFLNALQTRDLIAYVVDVNPRKTGMFVAGTGQEIVMPDFLSDYRPDVVLVMNPLYVQEIRQSLHARGLDPEVRLV